MSCTINLQNDGDYPVSAEWLEHAAVRALAEEGAEYGSTLTLVITDDETVADLNARFRGVEAPTDVLSFPADNPPLPAVMTGEGTYLGDLVIAYPYAQQQAESEGHRPADSFALLVVHGVLHLLGYDHDTQEARRLMWAKQERVLRALGISPSIVPGLENASGGGLDGEI